MPNTRRKNPRGSKNLKKIIRSEIQSDKELKRWSHTISNYAVSTTGVNFNICNPASGDGISGRIGHEIFMKNFFSRYTVTSADTTNTIRLVIYSKRNVGGASMAYNTYDVIDVDQYIVYVDHLCVVGTGNLIKTCKLKHKFIGKGKKQLFDTTSSGSATQGELLLYLVSDSSAVNHPTLNGYSITYYTE